MDPNEKYKDIINLSRPISARRPEPGRADRASQFAPFAALDGHDDKIRETARLTDDFVEYDENKRFEIDLALRSLASGADKHPTVSLLYFCPDAKKSGGAYMHYTGELKRIDEYERTLVFADSVKIKTDMLCEIVLK